MKRKLEAEAVEGVEESSVEAQRFCSVRKQLRSRLSRRRRLHISPIVRLSGSDTHFTEASEVSYDSSIASVSNVQNPPEIRNEFRRVVTRTYYRKNFRNESRNLNNDVELSDNSCVESCSVANRELSLKSRNVEESEAEGGDVTKSEKENSVETAAVPLHSVARTTEIGENKAASDQERRLPKLIGIDVDLACSEQFSNSGVIHGGEEEYEKEEQNSSSSGIFHVFSDSEFESLEHTQSSWSYASGSQFSEKSNGDKSSSPTFELFREFRQRFCRSTFALKDFDDHNSTEINRMGLEDEEDASFRMMRKRERRQEYVRDYAVEYCNNTAYGNLVIEQRLHMVHWIVEQAANEELQNETMFLGASLLDRFLSKGYFKNARNLQIAGIACLTLATRMEENQPYNCVRKKIFYVGSTIYGRSEVVAMEWLVLEALNYQCFLPTIYNFLWFYLKAARANENVEKTAKYLAVLALMGHQQLCYWPSTVAAGLVILASIATNQDASCNLVMASMEWMVKYL